LDALRKEAASEYVDPSVTVSIVVNSDKKELEAKEPLQISGAVSAFLTNSKKIVLSFGQVAPAKASGGIGTQPRTVWAEVGGDRGLAERSPTYWLLPVSGQSRRSKGKTPRIWSLLAGRG
jgi:hypothetical protein